MPQTIKKLAETVNGSFFGEGEIEIYQVADLETAESGEISFVEKLELTERAEKTNAACLIVPENFDALLPCSFIRVKNPKLAFSQIAALLHSPPKKAGIEKTAQINETAKVGSEVFVGAFSSIGENSEIGARTQILEGVKIGSNVKIGSDCYIFPNVVIYENVSVGNKVTLHAGAVVGADGFGFVRGENGYIKFPQIGSVIIEDDVEVGANTCIDCGALGETRIGKGTKIDNLVQIAHNVQIGERVIIAAQTGISGSTIIESDCVIGGQVGMGDHATVKSGAIIGSQAGVLPGKIVRTGVWWGTPVQPLDDYKRQNALVKSLGRMKEEIKELKRQIELQKNSPD